MAGQGRFRGEHWAVGDARRVRAQKRLRSARWLRAANLIVYMGLAFFEQPSWCYGLDGCPFPAPQLVTPRHRLPSPPPPPPLPDLCESPVCVFGLPVLPTWGSQLIESACVLVFVGEMRLKMAHMSSRLFFASPWHARPPTTRTPDHVTPRDPTWPPKPAPHALGPHGKPR